MISEQDKTEITKWVIHNSNVRRLDWIDVNDQGVVDIKTSIEISNARFTTLPVKFGHVLGTFDVRHEGLTSLENCPHLVLSGFLASDNPITSLVGGPQRVGGGYNVLHTKLQTLEGLPQDVNSVLWLPWNPHMGYLRCCLVNVPLIAIQDDRNIRQEAIMEIINKYVGKGWAAMVPCARELIRAGFRENAKL